MGFHFGMTDLLVVIEGGIRINVRIDAFMNDDSIWNHLRDKSVQEKTVREGV